MKTKIFYLIILLTFSGCGLAIKEKIIHNYYITAPDDQIQSALSYQDSTYESTYIDIVGETVFAVGYNDKYIIVKQHPHQFSDTLNKTITKYHILQIDTNINRHTYLLGPLTLEEFENKRKELNIMDMTFTKVNHYLE